MKYRQLEYSRTFNLGDYQSERISLTVDLDDVLEDLDETFKTTKAQVFRLHEKGSLLEETRAVVEAEKQLEKTPSSEGLWDPEKIGWVEAEGARGPYQRYPAPHEKADLTVDYENMLKDLKEHGGKITRDSFFYWLWTDGATVGRKPKRS